jgi:hypothetical protein
VTTVQLHKASDMASSKPVLWRLAPGYLAAGKVNLLVGAEGLASPSGRFGRLHRSPPVPHGDRSPLEAVLPTRS